MLGGVADAIHDWLMHENNPLNFPGFMNRFFEARGGLSYVIHNLWLVGLVIIALYLLNGVFQYLRARWTATASESIAKNMRDRLYAHLQTLPYDYHVKAKTGDLIQRCTSDVETIRRFLQTQIVEVFRAVLMLAVALVLMLGMNVKMTLVSMVLVPPLFVFAMLFFKWVRKSFTLADEAEGKMSAILQENLTGVRVVRAFGRQQFEIDKFDEANDDLWKKNRRLCDLLAGQRLPEHGADRRDAGIRRVSRRHRVHQRPERGRHDQVRQLHRHAAVADSPDGPHPVRHGQVDGLL